MDAGVTSGGPAVTNGARRRLAVVLAVGFVTIIVAITIGNAESTISDLAAAGVAEAPRHVWIWEITSVLAWMTVLPAMWIVSRRLRPPLLRRPMIVLVTLLGLPIASAWHVGLMIGLRHLAYAAFGESYSFKGGITDPYLYEFRKDVATYLQFVGAVVLAQWLLHRAATATEPPMPDAPAVAFLSIADGATKHRLPVAQIAHVTAAGNYVEVATAGRTLLHRATLAAVEAELGSDFVRIHRSRLVRRTAIRRIDADRSGDFTVVLDGDAELRGSRRYRAGLS